MSEAARSRTHLERLAREAVKAAPGCAHVIDVQLQYLDGNSGNPNWRLCATTPPLPPAALIEAHIAVERLAAFYLMIDEQPANARLARSAIPS